MSRVLVLRSVHRRKVANKRRAVENRRAVERMKLEMERQKFEVTRAWLAAGKHSRYRDAASWASL